MAQNPAYSIRSLTDSSLIIGFGDTMDREVHEKVMHAYHTMLSAKLSFVIDLVPAYSTLGVVYNLVKAQELPGEGDIYSRVVGYINEILSVPHNRKIVKPRQLRVPVCYEKEFAPDLENLARSHNLMADDVIAIHCSIVYDVYMLGFLPGFAYMGVVDGRISSPRLQTPRTRVPKGSVGIAGNQTGIYPTDSPGGWQLIGRTPVELFNPDSDPPTYFLPGDQVIFYPITSNEFENY